LSLPFSDVDDFKVANAKFPLDMALAFSNANALRTYCSQVAKIFKNQYLGVGQFWMFWM